MRYILSEKATELLLRKNIIPEEDAELYAFGLHDMVMIIVLLVPVLVLAALIHMLGPAIIFILAYLPIRIYGGGYHADTEQRCYVSSLLKTILAILLIKWLPWNFAVSLVFVVMAGIVIFVFSPIENEHRLLSPAEFVVYRRRARLFLMAEVAIVVLAWWLGYINFAASVLMALIVASLSMVLGLIKTHLKNKRK